MFSKIEKWNRGRTTTKILATLLVITLTFANFALLGSYIGKSYATDIDLNSQDNSTNSENVKFDVYVGQIGQKQISKDINDDSLVLGMSIKVENGGYFSQGQIELQDANFRIKNNETVTKIPLNAIQSGKGITTEVGIVSIKDEDFKLNLLNMISNIKLTGKYTNNEGNTVDIDSSKKVQVIWNSENITEENNPINLSQEIITNKIRNVLGENKRVIQVLVNSGLENNVYPIKETNIELNVPSLGENGTYPEEVIVASYDTIASNGKDSTEFGTKEDGKLGQWTYNEEEHKVNIKVQNPEIDNNIKWAKNGTDKFVVTYVYDENADVTNINSNINSKISLYGDSNVELTKPSEISMQNLEEKENEVNANTSASNLIYKSNMNIGQETEFDVNYNVELGYSKIFEEIKLTNGQDQFVLSNDEKINANTYYKATYINKNELLKILGEEGTITLAYINAEGEVSEIETVTKDTESNENGIITVNYEDKISTLIITTSEPVSEGKLNISHKKMINAIENKETIDQIKNINTNVVLNAKYKLEEAQFTNITKEAQTAVEAPKTEIQLGIDNTNLSTTKSNNINITATLKTNNLKYDLYTNPIVEITLPKEIEKIDIKDVNVLNANGLQNREPEIVVDENGNKIVKIQLDGEQKQYLNTDTQVLINADVQVSKLLPTIEREITLKCTNGKETVYADSSINYAMAEAKVKLVAEQELLLATNVSNYNANEPEILAFKNEEKQGLLNAEAEQETTMLVKAAAINNTGEALAETTVIGKINNNSNIEAKIKSAINAQNAAVYYTEDAEVSKESNWTQEFTENAKGYKIVYAGLENGQIVEFSYEMLLPAKLGQNKNIEIGYLAYTGEQAKESPKVTLKTELDKTEPEKPGEEPPVEKPSDNNAVTSDMLSLAVNTEPETTQILKPGQEVIYNIDVTNLLEEPNKVKPRWNNGR